jgi:hypothetical protein
LDVGANLFIGNLDPVKASSLFSFISCSFICSSTD